MKIWDLNSGNCKKTIDNSTYILAVKFSPDGNFIAFGGWGGFKILDLKNDYLFHLQGIKQASSLAFSPSANQLASSCSYSINLWSYNQNIIPHLTNIMPISELQNLIAHYSNEFVLLRSLDGHVAYINCLDFSPNGQYLASGSEDKTIKIWDVKSGNCIKTLEVDECIYSIAFSLDGNYVISGATKYNEPGKRPHGRIKIWDINTGNCIQDINYSEHYDSWIENIRSVECQRGCILSTAGYACVILKNERFNALYGE